MVCGNVSILVCSQGYLEPWFRECLLKDDPGAFHVSGDRCTKWFSYLKQNRAAAFATRLSRSGQQGLVNRLALRALLRGTKEGAASPSRRRLFRDGVGEVLLGGSSVAYAGFQSFTQGHKFIHF